MNTYPVISRTMLSRADQLWQPPRVQWPDGARCVVVVTIDFDGPSHDVGQGFAPLGSHSTGRYAGRRGIARHLRVLERAGVPATFFVPGYDAEWYPDIVRQMIAEGHEVGAHGYEHERTLFAPEEEERRLRLTHDILSNLTGQAPVGWRSPSGQKTYTTLKVLHELGYRYDASDKDYDMPYMLDLGENRSMVEIPNNTYSLDDHPWYHFSTTPVSEVLTNWQQEFSAIYAERGFYFLSLHPRSGWGSGTPSRSAAFAALLDFIKSHCGVRFLTLSQVCDFVLAHPLDFEQVAI